LPALIFLAFAARDTWFLNLDTVGSGRLVLLEGEGTVRMHDYDRAFKDLVARCAAEQDIPLLRGLRSHNSTDGSVPHRHGYPTATVVSVDDRKLLPHLPSRLGPTRACRLRMRRPSRLGSPGLSPRALATG
jgi:hypothetical protein